MTTIDAIRSAVLGYLTLAVFLVAFCVVVWICVMYGPRLVAVGFEFQRTVASEGPGVLLPPFGSGRVAAPGGAVAPGPVGAGTVEPRRPARAVVDHVRGLLARVIAVAGYRLAADAPPGSLPGVGRVETAGTVATADERLRSPVDGTPCVLCSYVVDVYDDPADAKLDLEPSRPALVRGVDAVPFHVTGAGGSALVDPVPWEPDAAIDPERRGRSPGDYATTELDLATERTATLPLADLQGPVGERIATALRARCDEVGPETYVRIRERRIDPGETATVFGYRLPADEYADLDRDVVNPDRIRYPFRIRSAPTDGTAPAGNDGVEGVVTGNRSETGSGTENPTGRARVRSRGPEPDSRGRRSRHGTFAVIARGETRGDPGCP